MDVLRALALGAVLCFPCAAGPQDVQALLTRLREGDGEAAARDLESDPVRRALKADPGVLSEVCLAGAASARLLARKSPDAAPRVGAALLALTADGVATGPGDPQALRGRFDALLLDGRIRRELGLAVAAEPFVRAGEGLELLYQGAPKDGFQLAAAARAFAEGAEVSGDKGRELWDRAEGLVAAIRQKHPDAAGTAAVAFGVLLDRVRWGASHKDKGLEARLESALEYLAAARKGAPENPDLRTAFNDAVSAARELKFRRPVLEFETERISPCSGLQVTVPMGRRWKASATTAPHVTQIDPDLGPIREFEFTTYQWSTYYDLPDGSRVAGDSMKDLAGKHYDMALGRMKKVTGRRPVVGARLKQVTPGWMFEVEGVDAKGTFLRRREWYFKSAVDRRQTYRISVAELFHGLEDDPGFESVLEGVRETPK